MNGFSMRVPRPMIMRQAKVTARRDRSRRPWNETPWEIDSIDLKPMQPGASSTSQLRAWQSHMLGRNAGFGQNRT